jgi:putative transcriptional regulator
MSKTAWHIRYSGNASLKTGVGLVLALLIITSAVFLGGTVLSGTHPDNLLARIPDTPDIPEPDPFGDEPAKGKFLVAGRDLGDPRFRETVVLLISYDSRGAAGLIINRPTEVPLADMLPDVAGIKKRSDIVYYGGPVDGHRMLMLIRSGDKPVESTQVLDRVYLSSSRDLLERMTGARKNAGQFRVYAGYAGWAPGQLDAELSRGDWHILRADANTIFDRKSDEVWPELIRKGSAIQVRNQQGEERRGYF